MYVKNPSLGALGQTASTQFTAGSTVTLTFTINTAEWMGALANAPAGDAGTILSQWSLFSSGAFQLNSVTYDDPTTPSLLTVVFTVGPNGAQYTYGLLSSTIASTLNSGFGGAPIFAPSGLGPGLVPAPIPAVAALESPSISLTTLLNSWANLISGGSVNTPGPPPQPAASLPWGYILLIVAGLAFAYEVS